MLRCRVPGSGPVENAAPPWGMGPCSGMVWDEARTAALPGMSNPAVFYAGWTPRAQESPQPREGRGRAGGKGLITSDGHRLSTSGRDEFGDRKVNLRLQGTGNREEPSL